MAKKPTTSQLDVRPYMMKEIETFIQDLIL